MTLSTRLLLTMALLAPAACSCGERGQQSSHPDSATRRSWTVTPRGIGPVTAGMTVAEARAALGSELPAPADSECDYITPAIGPRGVQLMVVDDHVVRVDVRDSTVATSEGAWVGYPEAKVEELYKGRVAVTPQKYTLGHYLTVTPAAAADSQFRLIFESDSGRVRSFRAGILPMVEWVEGCS